MKRPFTFLLDLVGPIFLAALVATVVSMAVIYVAQAINVIRSAMS